MRRALQQYRDALERAFGERLRLVRVFGSWARGQATEQSDVDIAVVIDDMSATDWKTAHALSADIALTTELSLSPLVLSTARFEQQRQTGGIAREIERDGIAP